jgi:hypothetical protein
VLFFAQKHAGSLTGPCVGIDVGQSINRICHTTQADDARVLAPAMLPQTLLWIFEGQGRQEHRGARLLLGAEAMLLQGWPVTHPRWRSLVETEPAGLLSGLAGNAFPSTTFTAVVAALLFAGRWQEAPEMITREEDAVAACALFSKLGAASL